MESFFGFVKSFCAVAVAGGLVMLVSPNGKTHGHIKFIISLCMISALLSAFISAPAEIEKYLSDIELRAEESVSQSEQDARLTVVKTAKKNMESEISRLLCARYGFSESDVYVVVTLDTGNLSAVEISAVTVFIDGADAYNGVCEYLSELFMGCAEIIIMEKG